MNVPGNLKYTKDHEWLRVEGFAALSGVGGEWLSHLLSPC